MRDRLARRTTPDDVAVCLRAFEGNWQVRWEEFYKALEKQDQQAHLKPAEADKAHQQDAQRKRQEAAKDHIAFVCKDVLATHKKEQVQSRLMQPDRSASGMILRGVFEQLLRVLAPVSSPHLALPTMRVV